MTMHRNRIAANAARASLTARLGHVAGLAAASSLLAGSALAHTGHAEHGFAAAFAHPFAGLDHLLAMGAVGWLAATRGARASLAVPVAFVASMSIGAVAAWAWAPATWAEAGIAVSLLALAGLLTFGMRLSAPILIGVVAAAALPHGLAHGAELSGANGLAVIAGFSLSTAILHAIGFASGLGVRAVLPARGEDVARWAGGLALAAAGMGALAGF